MTRCPRKGRQRQYLAVDKPSGEINTWRSQLKGKVSKLNAQIAKRNKYLKSLGRTAAERKADPEYATLLTMLEDYSHTLNVIKDYRREHAAQPGTRKKSGSRQKKG